MPLEQVAPIRLSGIERALGEVSSQELLPEYYETEEITTQEDISINPT